MRTSECSPTFTPAANAPLFGVHSVFLGAGVVGGSLMSIDDLARSTADVAIRLLNGAPPAASTYRHNCQGQPMFDWRELQRWGIPESRLPPGSVVRYRAPSLWSEYRGTVLSAVGVLAVQSLLIVGLLYQRRARQRAEIESRRNLALAADASRRQTMSALTSSIAHELGQPLTLDDPQRPGGSDDDHRQSCDARHDGRDPVRHRERGRPGHTDHRSASDNAPKSSTGQKPIDLHAVIHESLALVAHDMRARQIEATVNLSSNPCIITGDQVLLQQVLVNLVMNAMDAMAETPPARRRVTISTEVRAADVEVSVRDAGTGLPAQIKGTLFTPFVTTKAHGLGIGLDDHANDRRRAWWHHRCPQQSRRGRDIHCHPAPQRNTQDPVRPAECRMTSRRSMLPKRPRVLLAEDHPGVAKAVCRVLALDCDVVGSVADGSAVLEAAQRLQPDVIVVDLNLPNVNGLEACRQITQVNPEAKVIVFSAMNDPDVKQRSFEVGASAFVCKGDDGDLLSTIKRLCDDRG